MNYKYSCLSAAALKNIALITMIIDHFAAGIIFCLVKYQGHTELAQIYYACRYIGRLAFPIYCYFIVEGFYHTSNIKKYLLRLFIFALISEVVFDMALKRTYFELTHQNVFFTLFLGLLAITGINYFFTNYIYGDVRRLLGASFCFAVCALIAHFCKTDYSEKGVLIIVVIYVLHGIPILPEIIGPTILAIFEMIDSAGKNSKYFEVAAILAIPLLLMYNGKKGRGLPQYLYYIAYPLHLLIIGIICMKYLI